MQSSLLFDFSTTSFANRANFQSKRNHLSRRKKHFRFDFHICEGASHPNHISENKKRCHCPERTYHDNRIISKYPSILNHNPLWYIENPNLTQYLSALNHKPIVKKTNIAKLFILGIFTDTSPTKKQKKNWLKPAPIGNMHSQRLISRNGRNSLRERETQTARKNDKARPKSTKWISPITQTKPYQVVYSPISGRNPSTQSRKFISPHSKNRKSNRNHSVLTATKQITPHIGESRNSITPINTNLILVHGTCENHE